MRTLKFLAGAIETEGGLQYIVISNGNLWTTEMKKKMDTVQSVCAAILPDDSFSDLPIDLDFITVWSPRIGHDDDFEFIFGAKPDGDKLTVEFEIVEARLDQFMNKYGWEQDDVMVYTTGTWLGARPFIEFAVRPDCEPNGIYFLSVPVAS